MPRRVVLIEYDSFEVDVMLAIWMDPNAGVTHLGAFLDDANVNSVVVRLRRLGLTEITWRRFKGLPSRKTSQLTEAGLRLLLSLLWEREHGSHQPSPNKG